MLTDMHIRSLRTCIGLGYETHAKSSVLSAWSNYLFSSRAMLPTCAHVLHMSTCMEVVNISVLHSVTGGTHLEKDPWSMRLASAGPIGILSCHGKTCTRENPLPQPVGCCSLLAAVRGALSLLPGCLPGGRGHCCGGGASIVVGRTSMVGVILMDTNI